MLGAPRKGRWSEDRRPSCHEAFIRRPVLTLLRLIDVGFGRFDRNAGRVDREADGGARHQQVVGIAVHAAHVIAGGIEPADRRFVLRHDFKAFIEMPQGNI